MSENKLENKAIVEGEISVVKQSKTSLQPKGKLFGMDVFLWVFPGEKELASTIQSFPFPVLWIGNATEISSVVNENPDIRERIQKVIVLGDEKTQTMNAVQAEQMEDVLTQIKEWSFKPGILLFTSTDSDTEHNVHVFNQYLEIAKIQ